MIDLDRIHQLAAGELEPTNLSEELFLTFYTKALEGELLFSILLDIDDSMGTIDKLTLDETHYLVLGYAMGQHDLEKMEFDLADDKNKKLH